MSIDPEEASHVYGGTIIRRLGHEDGLMVNRLSWLVASQSFLFTAYAIVLNQTSVPRTATVAGRQGELLHIVPTLGLATSGLIYLGVVAGIFVTVALRRELKQRSAAATGLRPPLQGTQATPHSASWRRFCCHPLFCCLGCAADRLKANEEEHSLYLRRFDLVGRCIATERGKDIGRDISET